MNLNILKTFRKLITKDLIISMAFYAHLTFGFFLISFIAVTYDISHFKMATLWSFVFIFLYFLKYIKKDK